MEGLKEVIEGMLASTEVAVSEWKNARDGLPFPEFDDAQRKDQVWQSGLSEGKEIGRLVALRQVLEILDVQKK